MKITDITHIEDCFDGSFIKEFHFDQPITAAFIQHLGQFGQLTYFPKFARPFFKVIFEGDFYLKGVEGNQTARALLWKDENITFIKSKVC